MFYQPTFQGMQGDDSGYRAGGDQGGFEGAGGYAGGGYEEGFRMGGDDAVFGGGGGGVGDTTRVGERAYGAYEEM